MDIFEEQRYREKCFDQKYTNNDCILSAQNKHSHALNIKI